MTDVVQSSLPVAPWADPRLSRLPGVLPLDPAEWLLVDDAYAGQMALRDTSITGQRAQVLQIDDGAVAAAEELLEQVLLAVAVLPGFEVGADAVRRPDGVVVGLDRADPLAVAGRLVQEDFCLMQKRGEEHLLTGAVLCFPAKWMLAEKFMQPLIRIHAPIASYDPGVARRVQRLFDAIRPEQPLWRANAHCWNEATLFAPQREADPRPAVAAPARFLRSERQCLLRLPRSRAVVFSIHTFMVRWADLTPVQAQSLIDDQAARHQVGQDPYRRQL